MKVFLTLILFFAGCYYPCGPCWCHLTNGTVEENCNSKEGK